MYLKLSRIEPAKFIAKPTDEFDKEIYIKCGTFEAHLSLAEAESWHNAIGVALQDYDNRDTKHDKKEE